MWNHLVQFVFGLSVIIKPSAEPISLRSSIDELLTYECAKNVAQMLEPADQMGPVFSDYELVFTGLEASDRSRLILLTAGQGLFLIPLVNQGINRIRFALPAQGPYFMSFLYDPLTRSRVFEFSRGRPPMGKEETDFALVHPFRSDQLLPNLEYKIHKTAESIVAALTEGQLDRSLIGNHKAHSCEHLERKSPRLGQVLAIDLKVIEQIVLGPKSKSAKVIAAVARMNSSRAPASVSVYGRK